MTAFLAVGKWRAVKKRGDSIVKMRARMLYMRECMHEAAVIDRRVENSLHGLLLPWPKGERLLTSGGRIRAQNGTISVVRRELAAGSDGRDGRVGACAANFKQEKNGKRSAAPQDIHRDAK